MALKRVIFLSICKLVFKNNKLKKEDLLINNQFTNKSFDFLLTTIFAKIMLECSSGGQMNRTDDQLINRSLAGDNDSFGQLVERYQNKAYSISFRLVQNHDDALDCVQESFIKIFNNLHQFNFQSSFNTWLYRIVTNTSLDLLRKNKKYLKEISIENPLDGEVDDIYIQIEDENANTEKIITEDEKVKEIHLAINKLSEPLKKVIILFDLENFSLNEISSILNVPVGTVKSRLFRARERLLKILEENGTFY